MWSPKASKTIRPIHSYPCTPNYKCFFFLIVKTKPTLTHTACHVLINCPLIRSLMESLLTVFVFAGFFLRPRALCAIRRVSIATSRGRPKTLYQGDGALSTKHVCTIRAQLISATRGRASQPKVLAMATDCSATCQQG